MYGTPTIAIAISSTAASGTRLTSVVILVQTLAPSLQPLLMYESNTEVIPAHEAA